MRSCLRRSRTTGSSIEVVDSRGLHHVGVAVPDLGVAIDTYVRTFGASLEHREIVSEQGVEAASVLVGGSRVELLAPTHEDTPVGRFLGRRGPGVHHLAYEVDDVGLALEALAADGVELIDPVPRVGLFGLQVAFIHPDAVHGVLTEVVAVARAI
jgi:methylmalonyl-CoA/ethylmalonyl-CoA epimerase